MSLNSWDDKAEKKDTTLQTKKKAEQGTEVEKIEKVRIEKKYKDCHRCCKRPAPITTRANTI